MLNTCPNNKFCGQDIHTFLLAVTQCLANLILTLGSICLRQRINKMSDYLQEDNSLQMVVKLISKY